MTPIGPQNQTPLPRGGREAVSSRPGDPYDYGATPAPAAPEPALTARGAPPRGDLGATLGPPRSAASAARAPA